MDKVPFENNTKHVQVKLVNGMSRLVQPGESMMIDAPVSKQMVDAPQPRAELVALLAKPMGDIGAALHGLDLAQLEELFELEKGASKPRTDLLLRIQMTGFLKRPIKDIEPDLAELPSADLPKLRELELASPKPRETLVKLIDQALLAQKTNQTNP